MAVPTLTPGTDILSEQYNRLVRLFTGASGDGSDTPVSFSRYTGSADYAATIRHRSATDALYKGLIVQDKDGDTVFEVAALGSGGSAALMSAYAPRLTVGSLRNWVDSSDFVAQHQRTAASTTGAFVTAKFLLESAARSDVVGGSAVDDGPLSSIMDVLNVASGAGQNAQGTFRAGEFQTRVFASTDNASNCFALDIGVHTAVTKTGWLDNISAAFIGDVAIMIQSIDQSGTTGFGTGVKPNAGVVVQGALGWKYAFAYAAADKTILWAAKDGGSTVQAGNMSFSATSQRIFADLTNGTDALRLMFESTTANSTTFVGAKPSGSGAKAAYQVYARDDTANSEIGALYVATADGVVVESKKTGSATAPSIFFKPNSTEKLRIQVDGNICPPDAGLATNATAGFLYIPSCAGTPTGTPTVFAGTVPIVFDRTNFKIGVYTASAWKQTAALT